MKSGNEILIEVAKVDDWIQDQDNEFRFIKEVAHGWPTSKMVHQFFYLTSLDAILPVIERQSFEVRQKIAECLWGLLGIDSDWSEQEAWAKNFCTDAKTYCIALLQGVGKWKE